MNSLDDLDVEVCRINSDIEKNFLSQEVYLIAPSGKKYKTTRKAFKLSPYLEMFNKYDYVHQTEYTLYPETNNINHPLYNISDRHMDKIIKYLSIACDTPDLTYNRVPNIPDRVTLFLPSAIITKKWWDIVEDLTFEETFDVFNRYTDFLFIEDLKKLVELRMAYWIKEKVRNDLDFLKRPEIVELMKPIIENDVEREERKRAKMNIA